MKKLITLALVLNLSIQLFAIKTEAESEAEKKGIISGRIINTDNYTLPGATVYIKSIMKGTISDINGNYKLIGLKLGTYTITFSYVGFKTIEKEVNLKQGENVKLDIQLSDNELIGEVSVQGNAGGILKALNQQLTSANIVNVISSDQVGSFPDPNIGDALKRVPGIHVQYDQGEAKLISIRGTDPSKSTISINGASMPGTGDSRSVGVDAIPADMVQSIEVSKAITADMDGDAIGGAVNLVTRKAPYSKRLSISVGSGYNFLTADPQYNGSIIYGDRFFKKKLGVIASGSIYDQKLGSNKHNSSWEPTVAGNTNYFLPKYLNVEQTLMERLRQSYTLGLDFKFNDRHTIGFTGIYNDYKDWRRTYTLKVDDISGSYKGNWKKAEGYDFHNYGSVYDDPEDFADEIDTDIDSNGDGVNDETGLAYIVLDTNNDGIDDNTGKSYVDFDPLNPIFNPELERHIFGGANEKGADLVHKKIANFAFEGDHIFGNLKFDWNFSYIKTVEDEPDTREMELESENDKSVVMDYSDPRFISASEGFGVDNIAEQIAGQTSLDIEENNVDTWYLDGFKGRERRSYVDQYLFAFNLELPIIQGKYENKLKFGGKAKSMNKSRKTIGRVKWKPTYDPNFPDTYNWAKMWNDFSNNMIDVSSNFNNSKYDVGQSASAYWVGNQNVSFTENTEDWQIATIYNKEVADGYTASEDVYSAYLMSTQKLGNDLSIIVGLRGEQTQIDYHGWEYFERAETFDEVNANTNYLTLLPSAHLKFTPSKKQVYRLAYSKTISRPSYRDIVPYTKCDIKDEEIYFGNPDIKPTLSHNFDLLGELYTGSTGLVSAGFFFKNIRDFETRIIDVLAWEEVSPYLITPEQVNARTDITEEQKADYAKRYAKAEGSDFESYTPGNGGNANLLGIELAFQKQLDFLPGVLQNLSVFSNYTHNWVFNKDDEYELSGTATNIFNASLAYDNKKFSARISYNFTSDFLTSNGTSEQYNIYYDKVSYLDANVNVFVTPKIVVFASANNLLNQVQRTYQWKSQYTYSSLENGSRIQLGLKFNLFKS